MRLDHTMTATSSARPLWTCCRSLLVLGCLLGSYVPCSAANAPAALEPSRFEITQSTLREATARAAEFLHRRIVLKLYPSDPAHKTKVSLSMVTQEPDDLLNALTAAFGLRWLDGMKPGEVVFVNKQDYQG